MTEPYALETILNEFTEDTDAWVLQEKPTGQKMTYTNPRRPRNVMSILLAAALLSGCVTYGTPITQNQISSLVPGKTTKQQAFSMLGNPVVTTKQSTGVEIYSWSYIRLNGLTGISEQKVLTVTFGPEGKLTDYTHSDVNVK